MDNKVCRKCNIEKTIDEFNKKGKKKNGDFKYQSYCKACEKQYKKQHYQDNKVEECVKNRQRYQDNKEEFCANRRERYQDNKEELCAKERQRYQDNKEVKCAKNRQRYQDNKEEICAKNRQRYQDNKEHLIKQQIEYKKRRRETDLEFKLKNNIRARINCAIHSQLNNGPRSAAKPPRSPMGSGQKSARTQELLGISMDKYIRWIEFQLKDGWTWDNWGSDFHIDHVYPIAKHDLSKKEEQFKAFNWKNTRPMCKKENASKGAKIIPKEVFQHKVVVLAFLFHEINFYSQ